MTENLDGSEDGGDGDEAEPGERDEGIGVCRDGEWVGGVPLISVACLSETDAVEGAVDGVLIKNDIKEPNTGELLEGIVWEDGGTLRAAENRDDFGDPNSGARVWRAGPGKKEFGIL